MPQLHHCTQKLRDGEQQGGGDIADSVEALRRELELMRHQLSKGHVPGTCSSCPATCLSCPATCPSCPSCANGANVLATEPRQDGRCGPHFGNARCTHDHPWCNYHKSSGWCGNTAEHRDAQDDALFDWRAPEPRPSAAPRYMPATTNTSGIATNWDFAHGTHGSRVLKEAHVRAHGMQESMEDKEDEETWTETWTTIFPFAVLSFVFLSYDHTPRTPSSPDAQPLPSPAPEQEEQEPNACTSRKTAAARPWETQSIKPVEMSATMKAALGTTAASSTVAASPAPLENDVGDVGQVLAGDVDLTDVPTVKTTDVQTVKKDFLSFASEASKREKQEQGTKSAELELELEREEGLLPESEKASVLQEEEQASEFGRRRMLQKVVANARSDFSPVSNSQEKAATGSAATPTVAASPRSDAAPSWPTWQAAGGSLRPVYNSQAPPFSPWSPVEMVLSSFGDMSDDNELTFEQGVLPSASLCSTVCVFVCICVQKVGHRHQRRKSSQPTHTHPR